MMIWSNANPSFAIHPRDQGKRAGDIEIGGKLMVTKRLVHWLQVALVASIVSVPLTTMPAHSAGSCTALKKEFKKKIRPTIVRLAKKQFLLSNWYHVTLKKQQSGDHPTLADINATHKALIANCDSRSDKISCRKFATRITSASRRIFSVNKRWSEAGCRGKLNK